MKCSDLIVKFEDILHSTLFGEADQLIATHQLFFFKLKNLLILYQKSKKQMRGCKLQVARDEYAAYSAEGEYNGSSGKNAHTNHKVPE